MTILTSLSLYVSSLSSSGVRAMVASLPVIFVTGLSGMIVSDVLTRVVRRAYPVLWTARPSREVMAARIATLNWMNSLIDAAVIAGLFTLAATAVWLAFQNHRRIDRAPRDVVVQVGHLRRRHCRNGRGAGADLDSFPTCRVSLRGTTLALSLLTHGRRSPQQREPCVRENTQ